MKTQIFLFALTFLLSAPTLLTAQNNNVGNVVKSYYAAFDAGNIAEMEKLLSSDFTVTAPFLPGPTPLAAWKDIAAGIKSAFPDMQHPITDWFSDGKKVAVSGMAVGTNKGSFMGNPPTNNKINFPFTALFELTNDLKIKSLNVQFDQKAMAAQLMAGLPPANKATPVVNQIYTAFGKGDLPGILAVCDDNVTWIDAGASVGGVYKGKRMGKQGVTAFFNDLNAGLTITQFEPREFLPSGDTKMTVKGYVAGTAKSTGKPYSSDWAMIFEVNNAGKLVYHQLFLDTDNVCKALGASTTVAQTEANIRSLFAAMDAGQVEKFQDFCAADFMISHPFFTAPQPIAVFQGVIQGQKAGFPDMQHEITEIFSDGNKAAVRGVFKGTNTGSMQNNPPTNNKVVLPFTVTYDLDAQGKIKHQYVSFDTASFNSQLMAGMAESKK